MKNNNSSLDTTLDPSTWPENNQPHMECLGYSVHGLPLKMFEFGSREWPRVLCIGGVHGDEIEGVTLAWSLWAEWLKGYDFKLNLLLIPEFNPDGVLYKTRCNANQVDLNRNLPTKDWISQTLNPRYPPGPHAGSEPENQAFLDLWARLPMDFIFSFHSWNPLINTNGACDEVAALLHQEIGSPVEATMGYPTPGALGTFAGLENNVPTITLEIQRGLNNKEVIQKYTPALLKALRFLETHLVKKREK